MSAAAGDVVLVGLGNPILSDDGIGLRIAGAVREHLQDNPLAKRVDIKEVAVGGLSLAELLVGYPRAVIVDAIMSEGGAPGTIYQLTLSDLPGTLNMASSHDTNLSTALHALRRFGADVPSDDAITIVAVEASDVWTFSEGCTPQVEASLSEAVALVLALL